MTKTNRRTALAALSAGLLTLTALSGTAFAQQTTLTFLIDNAPNTVASAPASSRKEPAIGTAKTNFAISRMMLLWMAPTMTLGEILPIMISTGVAGIASRFS